GECNSRAIEATAAGALLFQEAGNDEVPRYFSEGREYVAYRPDDLETLLEYYLEHEDQRRAIAEAGRLRAQQYGFADLWARTLEALEADVAALEERPRRRPPRYQDLLQRTWQALHSAPQADPALQA